MIQLYVKGDQFSTYYCNHEDDPIETISLSCTMQIVIALQKYVSTMCVWQIIYDIIMMLFK